MARGSLRPISFGNGKTRPLHKEIPSILDRTKMLAVALLTHLPTAAAYVWPSPQLDALEAARFDQTGHNAGRIAGFIQPCDTFFLGGLDSTGRSNVGDWLRAVSGAVFDAWSSIIT
jgi:hypothetical protein